ncbi:MAG: GMC family oxidoreductase N-terminal domain-containing protein [bacterium]
MAKPYDYVIVGAGSAGCVLALRLTENPKNRVILLEAGKRDTPAAIHIPAAFSTVLHSERDWAYQTEPQPACAGRRMYWPRGKTLGGSSSINAMIYMRGNRADYDAWAAAGCDGWSYDEVLPHFRASEDNQRGASTYHGVGGPLSVQDLRDPHPWMQAVVAAARESGIPANADFNGATQDGVGFNQVTQRNGKRCSAAVGFLRPALRRPNLTVITEAHATKICFDGARARGVEYQRRGKREIVEAEREILLAGGAIESPHLLMLSGVGPKDQLTAHRVPVLRDLRGVGQHLEDHLCVALMWEAAEARSLMAAQRPAEVLKYLLFKKGMLTSNVAEVCAFVRSGPELIAPDLQLHFAPVYFDTNLETEPTRHAITAGPVLVTPASVGRIELASADPFTPPRIDPGFLSDPGERDLARLVHGVNVARRIFAQPALAKLRGAELQPGDAVRSDADLTDFVRNKVSTLYHPTGTCQMGMGADSVVGPDLRVHGLDGLRVVDASVMPRIPRGNTNAPTILIAEKAAALIAGA